MGAIVIEKGAVTYRQPDGEITAWLTNYKEQMELAHVGIPKFKRIFYLLVIVGVVYLGSIFFIY